MTEETFDKAIELDKQINEINKLIEHVDSQASKPKFAYGSGEDVIVLDTDMFPTVSEVIKKGLLKQRKDLEQRIEEL